MQRLASPAEVLTVHDADAAQVLLDRQACTWFRPFFGRPSMVSEAARSLGRPANSVLYRVRQWQRLGLLQIVLEERRRGRTVRHYRSAADHFFIPQALTHAHDLTELLRMINAPYLELSYASQVAFARQLSPNWGVRFAHWGQARLRGQPAQARSGNRTQRPGKCCLITSVFLKWIIRTPCASRPNCWTR